MRLTFQFGSTLVGSICVSLHDCSVKKARKPKKSIKMPTYEMVLLYRQMQRVSKRLNNCQFSIGIDIKIWKYLTSVNLTSNFRLYSSPISKMQ